MLARKNKDLRENLIKLILKQKRSLGFGKKINWFS